MKKLSNKKLLHLALCGILSGGLAGCKASNDTITPRDWQGASCNAEQGIDLLTGLNAEEDVDGIIAYTLDDQGNPFTTVLGGSPCSNALDIDSCNTLLDVTSDDYLPNSLILTFGDDVRKLEGKSEVLEFLGPIDTQQKALLWMQVNSFDITCDAATSAVAASEKTTSWFGLYSETLECDTPAPVDVHVEISINVHGDIKELNRQYAPNFEEDCNFTSGRIPPGQLTLHGTNDCEEDRALGAMFAKHAAYEAASVDAFNHLKNELEFYGAPSSILAKIQSAANDEVRHAEQVEALALQYGCKAEGFTVDTGPIRSLEEIAFDNMAVGCIGETWGALIGLYQASHAQRPEIRNVMRQIAEDEVGHAALSWEIHQWLHSQLSDDVKTALDSTMDKAILKLKQKTAISVRTDIELLAGLPSPKISYALVDQLSHIFTSNNVELAS